MEYFFAQLEFVTWGFSTIPMLVVFGVVFTLFTRFSQVSLFNRMFSSLRASHGASVGISNRRALLLSVGGRVGAGNVAGVAIAITLGGPGAVFWMWVLALVGMTTMLVECTLAQLYKQKMPDGTLRGGPLQTIVNGLGLDFRWLAIVFAICMILAYGIAVIAFQSNTAAGAMQEGLGVNQSIGGGILAIVFGLIVFGGIRRIAKASEFMVPIMAIAYIVLALLVIVTNLPAIPAVFLSIVENAFGLREAVSGGVGAAILHGMQRGLLSNEAGLGSASNVAGAAAAKHPVDQGITQAFGVFIDTIVICSCTAFIILLSDVYAPGSDVVDGIALTQRSLSAELGAWSGPALSVIVALIVLSSLTYCYYIAENGLTFITRNPVALILLRTAGIAATFFGALVTTIGSVLFFMDPLLGLMAVINLIVIAMLFPNALRLIKDYTGQLKRGIAEPSFDPATTGTEGFDPEAWPPRETTANDADVTSTAPGAA